MNCFVTADSNHVRLRRAAAWLVEQSQDSEVLILAPQKAAADHFARTACRQGTGMLGVHRMTLSQWAAQLATDSMAEENRVPLGTLATRALTSRCISRCQEDVEYFSPVVATPGFSRTLATTLSELRLQQVRSRQLENLPQPGPDLARLLRCFEQELAENSLSDLTDLFVRATQRVKNKSHRLLGLPTLFLDLVPATAVEKSLIGALAARGTALWITVLRAHEDGVEAWSEIVKETPEVIVESSGDGEESSLSRVRRFVFLTQSLSARPADESLSFFSAAGEDRECVEIVRRVLKAAAEGLRFDQMAVLLRNPDTYQPLLEESLSRAGIPAYFSQGTVRPDPGGRAFLALLMCAAERLSASRFAEYLSLGQVPQPEASGAPPRKEVPWIDPGDGVQLTFKTAHFEPDATAQPEGTETDSDPVIAGTLRTPFHWEKLLVDAAVIGGRVRWEKRLRGLASEFKLRLRELTEEGPHRNYIEKQLQRLVHLQNFALPLIEFLAELPSECRWGEWLHLLRQLASMALRQPDSVLAVLAELEPMKQVGPATLGEVQDVLTEWLRFLRKEPSDRPYGRLFVGLPQEAVARSFETVFVPGLGEGNFPQKTREDPLFLDEHRERLGRDLMLREQRSQRERLLLQQAAAAARSRLVISYPRMEVLQGRSRVPSFYALDVLRAAEGRLPDLGELEERAAAAGGSRLGWPAPREAQEAIDEAEYDLSLLDQLLHRPEKESRGRGRFLLEVNPCLARSLRTRARRWRRPWSKADGLIDAPPEVIQLLQSHRLTARAYSPTALQTFAACPYRFLLYSIYKLRPREEVEAIERMDPLTRGSLFHAVQAQLLSELQETGLLPVPRSDLASVLDLADQVLARVTGQYEEELAPAIPRVWRNAVEDLRLDLRGWIRAVASEAGEWTPAYFEFAFGLPADSRHDPRSRPEEAVILDGIRLHGAIDLIEENPQGTLRITDHKTGKKPGERATHVGRGEMLQPLLYALAAEQVLAQPVQEGRLFFCTQRGDYWNVRVRLNDKGRRQIQQVLGTIDGAIQQGFLPAAPRRDACSFCDYRSVCGPYEELRMERKDPQALAALQAIREML